MQHSSRNAAKGTGYALLGILGAVGVIYWSEAHFDGVADDLVATLERVEQIPEGQPLPAGWARERRGDVTLYYSPPTRDVCKRMTKPDFELPEHVVRVAPNKGHCWHKGGKEVMVFTVASRETESAGMAQ